MQTRLLFFDIPAASAGFEFRNQGHRFRIASVVISFSAATPPEPIELRYLIGNLTAPRNMITVSGPVQDTAGTLCGHIHATPNPPIITGFNVATGVYNYLGYANATISLVDAWFDQTVFLNPTSLSGLTLSRCRAVVEILPPRSAAAKGK